MPKISIIVPSFNSIAFIDETFVSICEQQLPKEKYEVIFVDGYSKDGTFEYLKQQQSLHPEIDMTILQSEPKGIYDGCNVGVRATKYEYVFILMSDDCLYPGILPKYLEFIEQNPGRDLYYAEYDFFDDKGKIPGKYMPHRRIYQKWLSEHLMGFLLYITFPTAIYRKSLHEQYGYFDDTFKISGDWDFFIKLAKAKSVTSLFYQARVVRFRIHPGSTSTGGKFIETAKKERDRVWKKHYPIAGPLYKSVYTLYGIIQKFIWNK